MSGGATSGGMFEMVIGLEIHVQLATVTKLFCADRAEFGAPPNRHVCPVCLGLPGALPVLNAAAVELAVRAALGVGCTIHETSTFARKNYFYPDLPKGYQITQYDRPLATHGRVALPGDDQHGRDVRIRRVHLEEDAGKSLHDLLPGRTAIDLNRAGVPLIEIVTEPDLRGPEHARAFLTHLKVLLQYLDVSDCDMEKGSLRVDANLSLRPAGARVLGTRTEIKNMNSFGNLERALRAEGERQTAVLEEGGRIEPATLLWDADTGAVRPMRGKEAHHDYRYFPEPDLPPLVLDAGLVDRVRHGLPELPDSRSRRLREEHGLPAYDAQVLTATRAVADYYEAVVAAGADPKTASNWVMTDVLGWISSRGAGAAAMPVSPDRLAELLALVREGALSTTAARRVFGVMAETGGRAAAIMAEEGLEQVRDAEQLEAWVDEVIRDHPAEADRVRQGDTRLVAFLMGRVMRLSGGRADPRRAAAMLRSLLGD
jgi:aspartyl-tRNA(Asn)/glutamyl-tRNA(Gln) amidotransferase subunit B